MEKLKTAKIIAGSREVNVEVYGLEDKDELSNLSRVYVIAVDKNKSVPLIYNSKRDIWGFPGGHVDEGESCSQTASRECIEEIKKTINDCQPKFLLINKIDNEEEENQVVCFAKIGRECTDNVDENESVKKVIYVPIGEIISKIGNEDLWGLIVDNFKLWIN